MANKGAEVDNTNSRPLPRDLGYFRVWGVGIKSVSMLFIKIPFLSLLLLKRNGISLIELIAG